MIGEGESSKEKEEKMEEDENQFSVKEKMSSAPKKNVFLYFSNFVYGVMT
jgi:hypothetical protein